MYDGVPVREEDFEELGTLLDPIIPVTITGPRRKLKIAMLLDSGADISFIPHSIGKTIDLTLDPENRSEISGIANVSVPYILSKVTLGIGDVDVPARIGWALTEDAPLILGRLDVFDKLAIEFRAFENKIILNECKA
ncbi:MAG: hypothetical protein GY856_45470 [bacterium]|nr:hypothetical protein [bacterium]